MQISPMMSIINPTPMAMHTMTNIESPEIYKYVDEYRISYN